MLYRLLPPLKTELQTAWMSGALGTRAPEHCIASIILVNEDHEDDCLQVYEPSRNIAPITYRPIAYLKDSRP